MHFADQCEGLAVNQIAARLTHLLGTLPDFKHWCLSLGKPIISILPLISTFPLIEVFFNCILLLHCV